MSDPTRPTGSNKRDNEDNKFKDNSLGEVSVKTVSEITNTSLNPVPVTSTTAITEPTIINFNINVANDIYEYALPNGTSSFFFRHRNEKAVVEFGFVDDLSTYVTLPKKSSFSESNINAQSDTLYFRSNTTGILEILVWVK